MRTTATITIWLGVLLTLTGLALGASVLFNEHSNVFEFLRRVYLVTAGGYCLAMLGVILHPDVPGGRRRA